MPISPRISSRAFQTILYSNIIEFSADKETAEKQLTLCIIDDNDYFEGSELHTALTDSVMGGLVAAVCIKEKRTDLPVFCRSLLYAGGGSGEFFDRESMSFDSSNSLKGNAFSSAFMSAGLEGGAGRYPSHIVGSVSNIENGGIHDITRIKVMLRKEVDKRERLLSEANEKGIINEARADLYQRAGDNKEGENLEALPSLIIVVDEFVELIENYSDMMSVFGMIARKGRSLGIHLVLSAQKLSGKLSSQITANANARISFRVLDDSDSNEMIGSNKAGHIMPGMFGRGFASLNGTVKEFQTMWTGAKYEENKPANDFRTVDIYGVLHNTDKKRSEIEKICERLRKLDYTQNGIGILESYVEEPDINNSSYENLTAVYDMFTDLIGKIGNDHPELARKMSAKCKAIELKTVKTELQELVDIVNSLTNATMPSVITAPLNL